MRPITSMNLGVRLNPATDVNYAVAEVTYGATHLVGIVGRRAGGKALNAPRVLRQLEEPVLATGLADCGSTGLPRGRGCRRHIGLSGLGGLDQRGTCRRDASGQNVGEVQ